MEQIGAVLVPQIMKGDVDGLVGEQIGTVPVLQIWEPIVDGPHLVPQDTRAESIVRRSRLWIPPCASDDGGSFAGADCGFSVPQIMEDSLPVLPQVRVQTRTQEQIVGVPAP